MEFSDFKNELENELSKDEIIDLLFAYNDYVHEFLDTHDEGCTPVCISEFYYNDYLEY